MWDSKPHTGRDNHQNRIARNNDSGNYEANYTNDLFHFILPESTLYTILGIIETNSERC